ncbi:MAG: hypothetical protein Tsb0020_42430 [Haliangiales bacterium]
MPPNDNTSPPDDKPWPQSDNSWPQSDKRCHLATNTVAQATPRHLLCWQSNIDANPAASHHSASVAATHRVPVAPEHGTPALHSEPLTAAQLTARTRSGRVWCADSV